MANPHSNNRGELCLKSFKRLLQDYVLGAGCLDSDAITQSLLAHANTPCMILEVSPAKISCRRSLRDFFPRNVKSLIPIPGNVLSDVAKE